VSTYNRYDAADGSITFVPTSVAPVPPAPAPVPPPSPVPPPPSGAVEQVIPGGQKIKIDTNRTGNPLKPSEKRVYPWDLIDTANRWPSKLEMAPSGAAGSTRHLSISGKPLTSLSGDAFAGSDIVVGNDPRNAGVKLHSGRAYVTIQDTGRGGDFVLEFDNS
jgi:hypothetical protein